MIYILTGDVHIGKTTAIANWVKDKQQIGGFLSPDIDGKRYLRNLENNEHIEFQVDKNHSGKIVEVGPYLFSKNAFDTASQWTLKHLNADSIKWIVIDEIGKLELKKEGFYPLVFQILQSGIDKNYLFVIRNDLLQKLVKLLEIEKYKLISLDQIESLG